MITKTKNIEDNIPDITNLATNAALDVKINKIKIKIPSITNLANASLNAWINEVKNEISSITDLATTTAFTSVENKIPNVGDLVKKADDDAEITDIKNKYSPYLIIINSWLKYLMQR